ncbi:hypothetical protein KZ483_16860 [Paenibacillus sp. sptzw28]|uniref:hypothetical protein n=1 Tax=Paenibacillus sp. sptzw28 TaxID=715179 RepID=UPI001C6F0ABD|nr:hypothetical protein [Paenibacillus sp. sptzw28]QYR19571.1 hypothetical protein KZ483_16860 [Paenibacillus sp. sptzw28]
MANFSGEQGGWFGKIVQDKFGLKLNIISQNLEGGANKFATQMASGNLGDFVVFGSDGQDYRDAIKAGMHASFFCRSAIWIMGCTLMSTESFRR